MRPSTRPGEVHRHVRQGGPRRGSGRPRSAKDTVRNHLLRLSLTESEYEVLEILGLQWDVPTATAAYGLLADVIATLRRTKPIALPKNLIYAASRVLAQYEKQQQKEHPEVKEHLL